MSAPRECSNEQTNSICLRADFSEVSNTLNCILYLSRNFQKNITVDVESTSLKVSESNGEAVIFNFTDIGLSPHTCRGLKYLPTGELHFSIQGRQSERTINGRESNPERLSLSVQNGVVEKILKLQNMWYCAVCRQKILKDSCSFSRVLPLPSENWSDMADMWFCHNHDDSCQQSANKGKLLPRKGECFVGETYVLVDGCHVKGDGANLTPGGAVLCYRCGQQIGITHTEKGPTNTSTSGVIKLFLHAVLMKDISVDIREQIKLDSSGTEQFFTRFLLEQSETYTSYRFILDTTPQVGGGDSKPSCCLIWLLDTHAAVFNSIPEGDNDWGTHEGVNTCTMGRTTVMKLLYKCRLCSADASREPDHVTNSVISIWKKDNSVHSISLPHPLLLQLISTLIQNTTSLPSAQRYLNGYHVSFLQHGDNH